MTISLAVSVMFATMILDGEQGLQKKQCQPTPSQEGAVPLCFRANAWENDPDRVSSTALLTSLRPNDKRQSCWTCNEKAKLAFP